VNRTQAIRWLLWLSALGFESVAGGLWPVLSVLPAARIVLRVLMDMCLDGLVEGQDFIAIGS
jgi:hypothetical protein